MPLVAVPRSDPATPEPPGETSAGERIRLDGRGQADLAKRGRRPSRDWLWPVLVAIGLLIIILIGLLTALGADPRASGDGRADATGRRVSIVSTVPGLGHFRER
jgi:hypothetical protein